MTSVVCLPPNDTCSAGSGVNSAVPLSLLALRSTLFSPYNFPIQLKCIGVCNKTTCGRGP